MKTKAINQLTTALLAMLVIIMFAFSACSNDDSGSDPDPIGNATEVSIPNEAFEVEVYRLTLTEFLCENCSDQNDQNNPIEIYGYISAWAEFDNDYINTTDNLETHEKTILFYRHRNHNLQVSNDTPREIKKSFDFYFNPNHVGKAKIYLEGRIKERDGDTQVDDDFGYEIVDLIVEDLQIGEEGIYELDFSTSGLKAKFKFEKVSINSDDLTYPEGTGPEINFNYSSSDYPPPSPTSYTSGIPASQKYVIIQDNPSKLYPQPNKLVTNEIDAYVYNLNPKFVSDSELEPSVLFKFVGDYNDHDVNFKCLVQINESTHEATHIITDQEGPGISYIPKYQIIEYWIPLKVWRIPAGVTKSYSVTYTQGWEQTHEYGLSLTLGYESPQTFAGTFSAEISATYNYSISSSSSKNETWDTSYSAPDDKNVVFITWQRINEIRLINQNGEILQDENYNFNYLPVAHVPSNDLIDMAYQFSASAK